MANPEHLALLKRGTQAWNTFRTDRPDFKPELSGADLFRAQLREANLADADFGEANLGGANLGMANLRGANLGKADLSGASLRKADLCGADLGWANLHDSNLSDANLRGAMFRDAGLRDTNLRAADMREANLRGADFRRSNLREANLGGANLHGTSFSTVNLTGADFNAARLRWTVFSAVNLSVVKGLESVVHEGPSTIGIDTLYESGGNIPHSFLRGAGVPDNFLKYLGSLTGTAFDFYSCFISYSTVDQLFAERLHADLQAKGVRCWFAPHDIACGRKLHEQIQSAIRDHDKLLLILSPASMSSDWVGTEIAEARRREKEEGRQMLFPLSLAGFQQIREWKLFDADLGKDSAREVREFFTPDFSRWQEDDAAYRREFDRLLRGLEGEAQKRKVAKSNVRSCTPGSTAARERDLRTRWS